MFLQLLSYFIVPTNFRTSKDQMYFEPAFLMITRIIVVLTWESRAFWKIPLLREIVTLGFKPKKLKE